MKKLLLRLTVACSPFIGALFLMAPAQAAPFAITGPTPTTAFAHVATEYTATFDAPLYNINRCVLSIDAVDQGAMTLTGNAHNGTAKRTATIAAAGDHVVRATCYDDTAVVANYSEATVTVTADTTGPTVSPFVLSPVAPIAGASFTLQTSYDDATGSGINTCGLIVDGAEAGLLSLSGSVGSASGTATYTGTVAAAGSHTLTVNCFDRATNVGTHSQVVVFGNAPDMTPPVVGMIDQSAANVGSPISLTAGVSDNMSVASCTLYIDGSATGTMAVTSSTASKTFTFTSGGNHTAYARCSDAAGNNTNGTSRIIAVADASAPTVGTISPSTAVVGSSVSLTANYTAPAGVSTCRLYVNGSQVSTLETSGGVSGYALGSYTFTGTGDQTVQVRCTDLLGHEAISSRTITVTAAGGAYARQLIKLRCPAGTIDVNHPCKAVYYVGSDNRRHAFPNSKVYFTWYADFSGVIEVDSSVMASFTLGANVTYRPGARMVKFTTLDRTYAVTRGGTLRWVKTEAVATAIYGSNWNTKIDDISDAFYANYNFGSDINTVGDYSASAEMAAVSSIDNNF
jgi:hypothetical protein